MEKKTRTLFIGNQKGGVGKTSAVFETGYILSTRGYKVLLIDADAQRNLTSGAGVDVNTKKNIYTAINGLVDFNETIVHVRNNLDLIPGASQMTADHFTLAEGTYALREAIEVMVENLGFDYDFILIDVGPGGGQLMNMALVAADYLITVATLTKFAYEGVEMMCADLERGKKTYVNFKVKPLGILVNTFKKSNESEWRQSCFEELEKVYGASMFPTQLGICGVMDQCKEENMAFTEYEKHTRKSNAAYFKLAKQYQEFVDELLRRIEAVEAGKAV
jgi:chromosome partitioning protein